MDPFNLIFGVGFGSFMLGFIISALIGDKEDKKPVKKQEVIITKADEAVQHAIKELNKIKNRKGKNKVTTVVYGDGMFSFKIERVE